MEVVTVWGLAATAGPSMTPLLPRTPITTITLLVFMDELQCEEWRAVSRWGEVEGCEEGGCWLDSICLVLVLGFAGLSTLTSLGVMSVCSVTPTWPIYCQALVFWYKRTGWWSSVERILTKWLEWTRSSEPLNLVSMNTVFRAMEHSKFKTVIKAI